MTERPSQVYKQKTEYPQQEKNTMLALLYFKIHRN